MPDVWGGTRGTLRVAWPRRPAWAVTLARGSEALLGCLSLCRGVPVRPNLFAGLALSLPQGLGLIHEVRAPVTEGSQVPRAQDILPRIRPLPTAHWPEGAPTPGSGAAPSSVTPSGSCWSSLLSVLPWKQQCLRHQPQEGPQDRKRPRITGG